MKKTYLNSFCARCLTLLVLALLSTNLAWGTEISPTAATTLKNGGQYVIGTASSNGNFLTSAVSSGWGTATDKLANAAVFTIEGDADGFYAKCTEGYLIPATSKTFTDYNTTKPSSANLKLGSNGVLTNKSNTSWALRLNTNFRWYSTTTGSAVYLFEVQSSGKKLTSIAISGNPTKTAYETGESFDVTGLTVTGTYDIGDPQDLTADAEWEITPATFTSTTQNSVSVTAKVGEKSTTENYNVTVTEHVITPGTYEISLNNDLYGISTGSNGTEQSVKTHDITVVSGCSSSASNKTYYDAAHIRYYVGSYLKLSVPAGYEITSVVFTEPSSDKKWEGEITTNVGTYSNDNKTWSGKAQEVDFTFGKQNRAASITVTFAEKKVVSGIAVKTAPTKSTYYVGDEFDPAGLVITASYASGDPEDIAYSDANKDAFSFSGFSSAAVATDQEITVTYAEKSATFTVNIEAARTLNSIVVASNPTKMVYEVGDALDLTGLVVNGIFSTGDPEAVDYTANPANGTILNEIGATTVTLTSVDNTELTTSFNVTVNAIEGDRITLAETGVTGGSYTAWTSSYTAPSGAVYTGNNAGGNSAIQLRSDVDEKKPASGIVSTTSGGYIKKVKVVWESHTADTRELEVFGSNTAYTAVADLVDNDKKGTSLGTIKNGTSTELTIDGYYAYVGVRSKSGAMYLSSITFVWEEPRTQDVQITAAKYATLGLPYAATIPEGVSAYTATVEDTKVTMTKIQTGVIPAECGVILYAETPDTYTFTETADVDAITGNQLVAVVSGPYTCTGEDVGKVYYLGKDGEKATFKKLNENGTIAAGKAYLKLTEALSEGAKLEVTFGEPTGIKSLTPALSEGKGVYNLNGMRVNPSTGSGQAYKAYKGIVIMNGKKYINK